MSLFQPTELACPACGELKQFQAVHSVNADRRPDFRLAILSGDFQKEPCQKCGELFRLQPEFTYLDLARNQWIAAFPFEKLAEWESIEKHATAAFSKAFGEQASPAAKQLGGDLKPRVTFGWPALAEKILAAEHQLDDVQLELLKMAILRSQDESLLSEMTELRLVAAAEDSLTLDWLVTATEESADRMAVPREAYDDIVADQEAWKALRDEVASGLFVDMQRLMIVSREPAA